MKFDAYTFNARVLPVYLTLAPVLLLLAAVLPDALKLPLGATGALVFVPLSFLIGQVGSSFGKKLEPRLWAEWGGPPTTRFLRHLAPEFNEVTRLRVHEKLRELGLQVPTKEEQSADPQGADSYFEACTAELIRRTRDTKEFPLVFKALTEYGFCRNLLGLKPFGLAVAALAFGASIWSIYEVWNATQKAAPVSVASALIAFALLFVWVIWVNGETVRVGRPLCALSPGSSSGAGVSRRLGKVLERSAAGPPNRALRREIAFLFEWRLHSSRTADGEFHGREDLTEWPRSGDPA